MKYYHISKRAIKINSILTQGIYGERIEDMKDNNYPKYIVEKVFEDIRGRDYQDLPSRLNCAFLYPSLEIAKSYWATQFGYQAFVYEVEILSGKHCFVEMDLLNCEKSSFSTIQSYAHKYWKQIHHVDSFSIEVLVEGEVNVTNVIYSPSTI